MRSLWRRFMAWWNRADEIEVYVVAPPEVRQAALEAYERKGHTHARVEFDTDQDGKVSIRSVWSLP